MALTLCSILTAYLLGEFVFRSEWINMRSGAIWVAGVRGAAVTFMSYLLMGTLHWRVLLGILVASTAMAAVEMRTSQDSVVSFVGEQCVSLVALLGLAWYFPSAVTEGWWVRNAQHDLSQMYFATLSCIAGLVACVLAGGVLIAKIMRPFTDEIRDNDITGLAQGGRYIGWLERILVFLLVLMDQPNGIGFLIAAKSVLRFGEIREPSQRKVAEYIIIGTFVSFGWALFISVLTQKAIKYWMH
jgi:hypothetical protein